ncbi:MAG: hypothetical protein AUJ06_02715 [Chloroflexi bacterium 13_1_40CM_3_70_6]|nr:MAG: hypothetical protein AUJ06_02715 [Chloroflexi bacterium 13_1_40CM_3_70_6]
MPPAVVVLALVAVMVPAGARALFGRPRALGQAWLLAGVAAACAQGLGELSGVSLGLLGDAQVLLALAAAGLAASVVAIAEGPAKR